MEFFLNNKLAFELNHPSAWCLQKEMKQKLLHMHLPTNKIIEHYNPGYGLSADRSVMRRVSHNTDYGQGKNESMCLTSPIHHRNRTK